MKKKIITIAILATLGTTYQAKAQFVKNTKKEPESMINWQNKSLEKDGVYGANINGAYELLKGLKPKKRVLVALIGTGIDAEHEDLKASMWINKKEKPNGKDDDKNGLVDDIHGWNFLGNTNGDVLDGISRESDREFLRLKDKDNYSRLQFQNGKYYMYDEKQKKRIIVEPPKDEVEFKYFKEQVLGESMLGRTYSGLYVMKLVRSYIPEFDKELKTKFPNQEVITQKDFTTLVDPNTDDTLLATAVVLTGLGFMSTGQDNWDTVVDFMLNKHPKMQEEAYQKALEKTVKDDRKVIGDNPYDINDKVYGNNVLMTENAGYSTLYAGIIAAQRDNNLGIDGIADNAEIMSLRIDADYYGEPYMKDMALAIRYAVDHGADIIQMGKTNTFYPVNQSDWVKGALVYAESKGVLVVIPMMDLSYNLDDKPFYPNRHLSDTKDLNNVITVAASDAKGNPYMNTNFSSKELDLFAPGMGIYSTYTGDTYRSHTGSDMAASVVTGVASLIKAHYPNLNGEQLRSLLMNNITSREGEEVEKQFVLFQKGESKGKTKDLFLFEDLCTSAGILNAAKAIEAAGRIK